MIRNKSNAYCYNVISSELEKIQIEIQFKNLEYASYILGKLFTIVTIWASEEKESEEKEKLDG